MKKFFNRIYKWWIYIFIVCMLISLYGNFRIWIDNKQKQEQVDDKKQRRF